MKYFIYVLSIFTLISCANDKSVYWCGDHACINKKEKEAYFKKTMIVEKKQISKTNKKNKSEISAIKKQAQVENKESVINKKELAKQKRLDEKRFKNEQKELAKQKRLDEKRFKNEQKELAKEILKEEKREKKLKKTQSRKSDLAKKAKPKLDSQKFKKNKIEINTPIVKVETPSIKFKEIADKILNRNKFRPFPDINDIPK